MIGARFGSISLTVAANAAAARIALALLAAFASGGCASAGRTANLAPTFEQKMASILRLEDSRRLREPPPAPPPEATRRRRRGPPLPPPPDLLRLLSDPEARVRRRAALAVGRVGLREGTSPLVALGADPDPEVRQMTAFALGLLGDKSARDWLVAALDDPSPVVQGSAAEALGLVGDVTAAEAIGRMVAQIVQSGALAQTPAEDQDLRRDTPAAAVRLGVYALVRLKAYEVLAAAVLDGSGQPRS
ncbi:MAG: HEAT repeat domain-containing protein, partial [Acidobacteria bacterium]|nr:HEAT repeat domain-containing protein [Acidobacteriota bacterium]